MLVIRFSPLLALLLLCLSCSPSGSSDIVAGSDVVAWRGDAYRQGRVIDSESSGLLVQWQDGEAPRRYDLSELAPISSAAGGISAGKFGLCRTKYGSRWWICRVESVQNERLRVTLLEDKSEIFIPPEDFITPSEGQRKNFVRRSAALLRSELSGSLQIRAVNPPAGMNLPVLPNQHVLMKTAAGDFVRAICGGISDGIVHASPYSMQNMLSAPEEDVAPLFGMEFNRDSYRKNLKPGDIVYASPDGARFFPARVESILDEGRLIAVLFADGLKMNVTEEFWLPQEE